LISYRETEIIFGDGDISSDRLQIRHIIADKYVVTKRKKTLKDNGVKVVSATEYISDSSKWAVM